MWFWCCGGGVAVVVLLLWWCGVVAVGREEFCLITGLRFGPENSDHYVEGINPYKRLLFGSDIDGGHITGQMLLDKINGEEFSKLQDEDAVAVCQLAVLHLVLLGRQPAHNIPEWWFRLIVDKNKWETYPWGSYVWAKLYRQLRYANSSRWDRFYACQALPNRPPAKYTLSGFTWAFKLSPCVSCVRGGKQTHPSPSISSKINLGRRKMLGEMWDCQLGNLTAGKVSGGGGRYSERSQVQDHTSRQWLRKKKSFFPHDNAWILMLSAKIAKANHSSIRENHMYEENLSGSPCFLVTF
ncbi:phospholipase-like protein [Tanacetum coccineum]